MVIYKRVVHFLMSLNSSLIRLDLFFNEHDIMRKKLLGNTSQILEMFLIINGKVLNLAHHILSLCQLEMTNYRLELASYQSMGRK